VVGWPPYEIRWLIPMSRQYDIEERLIQFAVAVCNLSSALPRNRVGHHIAGQLVRSGTSPAANYAEALSAESRRDFVHKMKICLKELRETLVWLKIVSRLHLDRQRGVDGTVKEVNELISIFVRSIHTAQSRST
jgi:four helix bundle protein